MNPSKEYELHLRLNAIRIKYHIDPLPILTMNKCLLIIVIFLIGLSVIVGIFRVAEKNTALPAPLPKEIDLKPKGNVTVIVSVPWVNIVTGEYYGPAIKWSAITSNLQIYKDVGADIMVLWPIWEHIDRVTKITVKTLEGEIDLKLDPYWWVPKDYLKLDPDRGSEEEFLNMIETAHALGIRVVPILQVSYTVPGGFIYEEHPEWILKSIYGGYAVFWPWVKAPWGYVINKADLGLIRFVTEIVIPHWVKVWGVDGVWLDSPSMKYCDPRVREICEKVGAVKGCECLTPVDGFYTTEPLAKALRRKIDQLSMETGRNLVCAGETAIASYQDWPDEGIAALAKLDQSRLFRVANSPRVKGSLGKYWDWVCNYRFRFFLKNVYDGGEYSYSENFVDSLKLEEHIFKDTEPARFVNMFNGFHRYKCLHDPMVAECYITLAATAPGRILWIGGYQLDTVPEKDVLRAWYKRLITIKKAYPALQSRNIENALVKPRAPRLIAYNRWEGNGSVTVIVNAGDQHHTVIVRTRFSGDKIYLIDLLHGDRFHGDPKNLRVEMPPHTARVLVELKQS